VEGLKAQVKALTQDLEKARNDYGELTTQTSERSKRLFEELKEIYDLDKQLLTQQIARLTAEINTQREALDNHAENQPEMEELRKENHDLEARCEASDQQISQLKEELKAEKAHNDEHQSFIQARMDNTRRMLDFAATTSEEVRKLKGNIRSLRETVAGLEESDQAWRSLIDEKEAELSELRNRLSHLSIDIVDQKVSDLQEAIEQLHTQCAHKDTQIAELREQLTIRKLDEGFEDSQAAAVSAEELRVLRACRKLVTAATALECEGCRHIISVEAFAEHVRMCMANSLDEGDLQSLFARGNGAGEGEKTVMELRVSLGEARNEQEKANLECEKLQLQLSHLTQEWNRKEEQEKEMRRQMKAIHEGLQTIGGARAAELAEIAKECLNRALRQRSVVLSLASL
jgi:chromosome segregation ATPase